MLALMMNCEKDFGEMEIYQYINTCHVDMIVRVRMCTLQKIIKLGHEHMHGKVSMAVGVVKTHP